MKSKTELESLLTKCYELEGLLLLAIERNDEISDTLIKAIHSKINTLNYDVQQLNVVETPKTVSDENDLDVEEIQENFESNQEISQSAEFEQESDAELKEDDDASTAKAISSPLKFSINDRYQYIRELFNGNEIDFKDAIDALEEMETREEIEDFLYNDLCLNEQDPTVTHFISTVMASKKHE